MLLIGKLYKLIYSIELYSVGNFTWSFEKNDLIIILGIEKYDLYLFYTIYSLTENSLCFCKDYNHSTGMSLISATKRV